MPTTWKPLSQSDPFSSQAEAKERLRPGYPAAQRVPLWAYFSGPQSCHGLQTKRATSQSDSRSAACGGPAEGGRGLFPGGGRREGAPGVLSSAAASSLLSIKTHSRAATLALSYNRFAPAAASLSRHSGAGRPRPPPQRKPGGEEPGAAWLPPGDASPLPLGLSLSRRERRAHPGGDGGLLLAQRKPPPPPPCLACGR